LAMTADPATPHALLLNRGDGSFARDRQSPLSSDHLVPNLGTFADFDNDGDMDVFVANVDTGSGRRDRLYVNDGRAHFTVVTNGPLLETPGFTVHGSWGDVDNDGDFDIVIDKDERTGPVFYRNEGGAFTRAEIGLTGGLGGAYWIDYDNDGHLDLYFERGQFDNSYCLLFHNRGDGTLESVTNLLTTVNGKRQGTAWGDYDNDGFMDLIEGVPTGGTRLFRNLGNANRWLKLVLRGTASNTEGLGALIRVRATIGGRSIEQMKHVRGMIVAEDPRPNFGLGDATQADEVRIQWPSGNVQILTDVAANQILTVTEPTLFQPTRPVATVNGTLSVTNTTVATERQWFFEGTEIPGATDHILTLPGIQSTQAGRYSVVAQTATGPQTNHVFVRVLEQWVKILEGDLVTEEFGSVGATWFDSDGDGDLDLFVANSSSPDAPVFDNYYLNQGNDTFVKVTDDPLVATAAISFFGLAADFDNDGDPDLLSNADTATISEAGDQLFLNDGKGHFTRLAGQPFDDAQAGSASTVAGDLDNDGDLDLAAVRSGGNERRYHAIYWNGGNAVFTPATAEEVGDPLLYLPLGLFQAVACFDYDGDG
ncbi:MAG: VCBS repeat-containing protein, partial [Nitrospira sp.]|nr:VCBS repeat-containing protein [Nitrospira sp.]